MIIVNNIPIRVYKIGVITGENGSGSETNKSICLADVV